MCVRSDVTEFEAPGERLLNDGLEFRVLCCWSNETRRIPRYGRCSNREGISRATDPNSTEHHHDHAQIDGSYFFQSPSTSA